VSNIPTDSKIIYRQKNNRTRYREFNKAPRVYVSLREESLIDNLFNRRNRPTKEYRAVAKSALKEQGITVKKMRWSQYAGCTCPCSPGFILDDYDFEKGVISSFNFDVFVSIGAENGNS